MVSALSDGLGGGSGGGRGGGGADAGGVGVGVGEEVGGCWLGLLVWGRHQMITRTVLLSLLLAVEAVYLC